MADDLGYGDLSCYGNTILSTPNIDRLAAEGVRCSQHYSGAPLCAPARAALLTGRYHHRCGALSVESNRGLDRIALRERTMGDLFGAAGYRTGYVGKWHSGVHDGRYHPNRRGFAEFAGFLSGIMDYWNWFLDYNGASRRADGRYQTDVFTAEAVDFIQRSAARRTAPGHTVARHAGQPGSRSEARAPGPEAAEEPASFACRQPTGGDGGDGGHSNAGGGGIRGAVPDAPPRTAHAGGSAPQPFFLVVAYHAPHSPLQAPDECCAPFRQRGDLNDAVATLYGMVASMDRGIGQILDALDAAGCADDTVVLVTSDNGPWLGADRHGGGRFSMRRFNGPFRGQKQEVLEGGIRVPAIVRWPDGLPAGAACDEMIHFCDWLPTLAAAAGVSADGLPLDGCNQLPRLRGTPEAGAPPRFWQFNRYDPVPGCNLAMRDGPWKLYWPRIPEAMVKLREDNAAVRELMARPHFEMPVSNPPVERTLSAPAEPELYCVPDDPWEARNLAAAHPERAARMRLAAENWFAEVEAERRELAANA